MRVSIDGLGNQEVFNLLAFSEKLKNVERANLSLCGKRFENTAEHSWQAALFAILLQEWSNEAIHVDRVVKILLVHDLVEIECGDVHSFDDAANQNKRERELAAANALFPHGSDRPLQEIRELWEEFEAGATPEAKFARAIDIFLPLYVNIVGDGRAWGDFQVTRSAYVAKKCAIRDGSERLWSFALQLIDYSVDRGWVDTDVSEQT